MKTNKISNLLSFFCLGLFLILILLAYSLNKRILSLETELLSYKEKIKSIEDRFNVENYKYLKNDKFLIDDNFKEFQKLIVDYVKKNIGKIILERPVLGGRWIASDIKFLSPDIIEVTYEDGHINDIIFLKIESAFDSKIEIKPFW